MKTLYLLRHAKSSWKNPELADFERPLNGRGKKAGETMGRLMANENICPELVLSSPAVRARETIEIVFRAAKLQTELRYDERIYEAGPMRLLEVISQVENERKSVMLVGHNPGMEELLQLLTGQAARMATAALAKVSLKSLKWSEAVKKKAVLEWLIKPKDLAEK
jgi:phosphohistidine phosphatase